LEEVKHHFGEDQFSFATQIERNDHRPVGVSFVVGNGAPTSITTAFGNIVVTRVGDSGTKKGTRSSTLPMLNLTSRTPAI
jgi:hypothetical protein